VPSRPSRLVGKDGRRLAGFLRGQSGGVQPRNGFRPPRYHQTELQSLQTHRPKMRRAPWTLSLLPKGGCSPRIFSLGSPVPARKRTWPKATTNTSQQGRLRDITKNRFPNTSLFLGARDAPRYPELGLPGETNPRPTSHPTRTTALAWILEHAFYAITVWVSRPSLGDQRYYRSHGPFLPIWLFAPGGNNQNGIMDRSRQVTTGVSVPSHPFPVRPTRLAHGAATFGHTLSRLFAPSR
jgi:hypothetical protein